MLATFVIVRVWLHGSPDSDFEVFGHNIHHLYTGLALVTVAVVPLLILDLKGRLLDSALVLCGIGLSLAADEWVYLIATDGSNASYLLPISLWGAVAVMGLTCAYIALMWFLANRWNRRD